MGEGRGGRGAISYDGDRALSSINQPITSGFNTMIIIDDVTFEGITVPVVFGRVADTH
jgi:hypothetical protein